MRIGRETQLSGVPQRPLSGELSVHDAVLRDQADPGPQLRVVLVQVAVVVQDHAPVGRAHPRQRTEQSRLAGAAGANDADQAPLGDREAHVVQQDLAPGDLHHQILRDQRHIAGVNVFAQLTVGQPVCGVPDADNVFLGERGGGNTLPVDKCAIVTAQVDDLVLSAAGSAQFSVMPGDTEVGEDEVIVGRSADPEPAHRQGQHRRGSPVHARPVVVLLDPPATAAPGGAAAAAAASRAVGARPAIAVTVQSAPAIAARAPRAARHAGAWHTGARRGGRGAVIAAGPVAAGLSTEELVTEGLVTEGLSTVWLVAEGLIPARLIPAGYLRMRYPGPGRGLDGVPAVAFERAGTGGGRGYFRRRVHRTGGWHAAQDRAVRWVTKPDNAVRTDGDPVYTLRPGKCPVRTPDVLKYPGVRFIPENRVTPRHTRVGHDDVGTRIPAQSVRGPRVQSEIRFPRTHHKHRASPRRAGTQR